MEIPSVQPEKTPTSWHTMLLPMSYTGDVITFAVRVSAGNLNIIKRHAVDALYAADPTRVIDDGDVATARIMLDIVVILLLVTAAGLFGLVSSWIRRRTWEIGIHRTQGVTKGNILACLQVENLLICIFTSLLDAALVVYLNSWLLRCFATQRLPWPFVLCDALAVITVSQAATLGPALVAANATPAAVIRRTEYPSQGPA